MAMVLMSRFSLGQSLFSCCSSCHATFGDELNSKNWASRDRQFPFSTSRSIPLPAAVASARGGNSGSDLTPRAAAGHLGGTGPGMMLTMPPPSLLVDTPSTAGRRSSTPLGARDPAAKALERKRLRQLFNDFMQEAASGRSCTVVVLDDDAARSNGGIRTDARYTLSQEVERFMVETASGESFGQWPLEAVLGTHKAEESALVQSRWVELARVVSQEELARAAVIEFGGGAFAGCTPLLLIEESPDHCEKFVSGMQILRLYKGAAQRLESARSDRRSNSREPMGLLAQVASPGNKIEPKTAENSVPQRFQQVGAARPAGSIGSDDPPDVSPDKETI